MNIRVTLLFFLAVSFSACQKAEIVLPIQTLNGIYKGEVTYVTFSAAGGIDTSIAKNSHSIAFEIENNTFNRPECGCKGAIAVDTLSNIALFESTEKACVDKGSSGDTFWSFKNDIIGKFSYNFVGDTLILDALGGVKPSEGNRHKTIVVVRQKGFSQPI